MSDVKLDPPIAAMSLAELCEANRRIGRQDALLEVADFLHEMVQRSPLAIAERMVRQLWADALDHEAPEGDPT